LGTANSQPRGPGGLRGEQGNKVDTMPVDLLFQSKQNYTELDWNSLKLASDM
jgi:hypothetical protein